MNARLALGWLVLGLLAAERPAPPTLAVPGPSAAATPGVAFVDATRAAGLSTFRDVSGSAAKDYILEVTGSGVALARLRQRRLARRLPPERLHLRGPARPGGGASGRPLPQQPRRDLHRRDVPGRRRQPPLGSGRLLGRLRQRRPRRTSTSRTSARTASTETRDRGLSPTWPSRRGLPWAAGPPGAPSGTTMATAGWTCSSPATSRSTSTGCRRLRRAPPLDRRDRSHPTPTSRRGPPWALPTGLALPTANTGASP